MAQALPAPDGQGVRAIQANLLRWYHEHRRDLPWRLPKGGAAGQATASHTGRVDPYHVLVSEAMLQQTQVATVVPYFHRFLAAFPTIGALAAAEEQQVLRLWQGLGYYRRARSLHAAAKAIVERHGGRVPSTLDQLLALPGVGRYTAGAIASIAFGVPAPILDGNVVRVLCRWFRIEEPADAPATRTRLWSLAEQVVPEPAVGDPGDFNQAMMELGATVCTPRDPKCLYCPVAGWCAAQRAGVQNELPRTMPKKAPKPVVHQVLAMRDRRGRYLFEQRPSTGLWSNMWQLPTREATVGEAPLRTPDLAAWAASRFGLQLALGEELARFTHATTHRDIVFSLHVADVTGGRIKRVVGEWRSLDNVDALPFSKPQLRTIAALRAQAVVS